jgi:hypothetical protein
MNPSHACGTVRHGLVAGCLPQSPHSHVGLCPSQARLIAFPFSCVGDDVVVDSFTLVWRSTHLSAEEAVGLRLLFDRSGGVDVCSEACHSHHSLARLLLKFEIKSAACTGLASWTKMKDARVEQLAFFLGHFPQKSVVMGGWSPVERGRMRDDARAMGPEELVLAKVL